MSVVCSLHMCSLSRPPVKVMEVVAAVPQMLTDVWFVRQKKHTSRPQTKQSVYVGVVQGQQEKNARS